MGGARDSGAVLPAFLLGALFGKLMEDSGSVEVVPASWPTRSARSAPFAVVLAGAIVAMAA